MLAYITCIHYLRTSLAYITCVHYLHTSLAYITCIHYLRSSLVNSCGHYFVYYIAVYINRNMGMAKYLGCVQRVILAVFFNVSIDQALFAGTICLIDRSAG